MYKLKSCSVCGAELADEIGSEQHNGEVFGIYKCPCCDSKLNAYDQFLKRSKAPSSRSAAKPNNNSASTSKADSSARKTEDKPVANIASGVYNKGIGSALELEVCIAGNHYAGSGTMLSDGYFLTNAHVVTDINKQERRLEVANEIYGLGGVKKYRFTSAIIAMDIASDLALLKVDTPNDSLVPVIFAKRDPAIGDDVYAIGNAQGGGLCILDGIVSDTNRKIRGIDHLMISALVEHGNSGGPVFNVEGELVGIVVSGHPDAPAMNYVITLATIKKFLSGVEREANINIDY